MPQHNLLTPKGEPLLLRGVAGELGHQGFARRHAAQAPVREAGFFPSAQARFYHRGRDPFARSSHILTEERGNVRGEKSE